ncbi:hypothetical protein FB451DRAFT_84892 [Mycena latifolia]|nr:hypothetical protein FB451DRAFT_84892 [Mycena latifolia]
MIGTSIRFAKPILSLNRISEETRNIHKAGKKDEPWTPEGPTLRLLVQGADPEAEPSLLVLPPQLKTVSSVLSEVENRLNKLATVQQAAASSDLFPVVLERVQKIIHIGGAVAELSPYAKVAWNSSSKFQALIVQLHRDTQVRALWLSAAEMLNFLKGADSVIEDSTVCLSSII